MVNDKTTVFRSGFRDDSSKVGRVLDQVYKALQEKGYNPIGQIIGYLMSGDPTYITSHGNARKLITQLERDEILEELIASYLQSRSQGTD
ncbi:MAG: IreB family regulatory phosphoprotein [Firmicutes bacterium]|mgnify:CR=1 FL=1|nr:IreB family regulatory phosphoprotein [Bacillota bacterium]